MSAAWSILIIVFAGIAAVAIGAVAEGREHVRGAAELVERMVAERGEDR